MSARTKSAGHSAGERVRRAFADCSGVGDLFRATALFNSGLHCLLGF